MASGNLDSRGMVGGDDQNGYISGVYLSGSDILHLDGNVMDSDWTVFARRN